MRTWNERPDCRQAELYGFIRGYKAGLEEGRKQAKVKESPPDPALWDVHVGFACGRD